MHIELHDLERKKTVTLNFSHQFSCPCCSLLAEVDDGLSVEQLPDGTIRLWVHVADPTRWLAPGSALDLEARARIRTLYYPHAMRPMFPANLSTGIFSLREGQVRMGCRVPPYAGRCKM